MKELVFLSYSFLTFACEVYLHECYETRFTKLLSLHVVDLHHASTLIIVLV